MGIFEIINHDIDEFIFRCSIKPSFVYIGRNDTAELKKSESLNTVKGAKIDWDNLDKERLFGLKIVEVNKDYWLKIG